MLSCGVVFSGSSRGGLSMMPLGAWEEVAGRLMGKSLVLFSFSYTYVEGPHGGDFLGKQGEGSGEGRTSPVWGSGKENGGGGEGFGGD